MDLQALKTEIEEAIKQKQDYIRYGQFVFNYIDDIYGVARAVQFEDGVDCFHRDDKVEEFLKCCSERINWIK